MTNNSYYNGRKVFIVDGARTPFLKARNQPGPFTASDLAVNAGRALLKRHDFPLSAIDEVITGCTIPSPDEANISRVIALRLGLGHDVPAWTVQRNCGSGMQAVDNAALDISSGRCDLVLCGGTEAMSHAPLLYQPLVVKWFAQMTTARSAKGKLQALAQLSPKVLKDFFNPVISLLHGLTDPVVNLSMGQTAENLAYRFHITREQMDAFAMRSHHRLANAIAEKVLSEVITIYDNKGKFYQHDDGLRADTTMEQLAKLKPFFDRKFGSVTAGNSSQITDGAAFLLLASDVAVKKYNLKVMGEIVDANWAALDPSQMGLGPVFASAPLLTRNNLTLKDVDYWEINEAFAAQVLACLEAFNDKTFCQNELGLADKLGKIDDDRLNVYGDAICMGHPIGASGARVVIQLLNTLKHKHAQRGVAALCIGGGQGGAMLIENTEMKNSEHKSSESKSKKEGK